MERIQKFLASANVGSRRACEALISEKRVKINGQICDTLGTKVSKKDTVTVDDKLIVLAPKKYFVMNKPAGYLSLFKDDKNRKTLSLLMQDEDKNLHLFPISKLDMDEVGVLLLTNDGDLTRLLTKKDVHVSMTFVIRVQGIVIKDKIRTLRKGIVVDNNRLVPKDVSIVELDKAGQTTLIQMTADDIKHRDLKKIFETMGHPVIKSTRIAYANITVEGVERGGYRELLVHEVRTLYAHHPIKKS